MAHNDYLCQPAGSVPDDYNIITETDDWHAARLGVNTRVALMDRLSATAEVVYLPYVFVRGLDHHVFRKIYFPDRGTGDGVQLEAVLDYALSDAVSLGAGARYWEWHVGGGAAACQEACNDRFPAQHYIQPPWGGPYDMHMFGGFAQMSYHLGRIAHDGAEQAPATDTPGFGWDGTYMGVQGGARAGQADWRTTCLEIPCSVGEGGRNANTVPMANVGGYFGALGGYLQTVAPGWLLGVEADAGWANGGRTERNIWIASLTNTRARPDDPATVKQDWDASLRLRGGFLVTPDTLAYATLGVALENVRASASCSGPPSYWCLAPRSESAGQVQFGYTLGMGAETALSDSLSGRLEYRYSDYGTLRHQFFAAAPSDAVTMATRIADQRLLLGLVYRP
jgi:opacity protein-like surface antigen